MALETARPCSAFGSLSVKTSFLIMSVSQGSTPRGCSSYLSDVMLIKKAKKCRGSCVTEIRVQAPKVCRKLNSKISHVIKVDVLRSDATQEDRNRWESSTNCGNMFFMENLFDMLVSARQGKVRQEETEACQETRHCAAYFKAIKSLG